MRAELPWNVAGIPPEAREAARAAARREGLSVGEWLTRRILRSFSGLEDELPPMPYDTHAHTGAPLDSWGLPSSTSARRDTEEMMARVGRSETESNDAWRRIEEQMRGLGRRLDSSERSHSESNRVISRTAQEMNITAREQAQAFDQLGLNVISLNERLERLERSAAHDGIKEAVKALHQGLSRLADQITATANNSASQVVALTTNLEQLANHVGQARVNSENADRELESRIDATEFSLGRRIESTAQIVSERFESTEQRLASAERSAQFNTSALDHALEKIETNANQRAADQVENQGRAAKTDESLNRLEDSIARLEMRLPDAEFERRLDGIERSVTGMADRLENYDPKALFDASMQAMSYRIESLEKDHAELMNELRAKVLRPQEPPVRETHVQQAPAYQPSAYEPPAAAFEAPPFAEPPSAFEPPPVFEDVPHASSSGTPGGFSFDIPPEVGDDPFAPTPDFADVFANPQDEPENFLTQARRSARAASEKAESERRGRFASLLGSKDAAESEESTKPRYVIPAIIALIVALAVAAGLILSQRARTPAPVAAKTATAPQAPSKAPTISAPKPSNAAPFVVAPPAGLQSDAGDQKALPSRAEPQVPPHSAAALQQREVHNAPVKPVAAQPAPVKAPDANQQQSTRTPAAHANVAADRVIQLANTGNPVALTILGLRDLDGTGGTAVNLPEAVRFLTQAAEKGQAVAQYRLGTLYERGQGMPADGAKASHWYELAATQGNRKAMHNLAVSYASGAAGKKNMAEAARWFAKAAGLGLSDSQFNLAVLYERGDGVPQSLLDAYKWYSIAAAAGDSESKQRIAVLQTQLGDADKAAANKSAATFHAVALNRAANVPPELSDLN
jgi:localization factor PodJL